jgi:vacuolar protein sorting-associated protein 54
MKALMKQTIVEALAANDTDVERGSMLYEQLKHLNFMSWTNLMQRCMVSLIALLNRIRAIHDIMAHVLATETSRQEEVYFLTMSFEEINKVLMKLQVVVTEEDRQRLQQSLKEMIQSLCDSAHDQCGRLLSSRTKDGALLERVSSQEFVALAKLIETFVLNCQNISGHKAMGLRLAFQVIVKRCVFKCFKIKTCFILFYSFAGSSYAFRSKIPRRTTL